MANKKRDTDLLDWTITAAPDPDEPPSPSLRSRSSPAPDGHSARHARKLSRQLWLTLGGLIAASLLGLAWYTAWNRDRVQRNVSRIIALEEQAALAGDVQGFVQLSENNDPSWRAAQIRWASNRLSAPLPLPTLRSIPRPGTIQTFQNFTMNIVRADVARTFTTPDGKTLGFTLTQFYRFGNGAWKRMPPPVTYWGEAKDARGIFTNIRYYAVDTDFVADLSPYLEDVLRRACAAWDCPPDFKLQIALTRPYLDLPRPEGAAALSSDEPFLFASLSPNPSEWADDSTSLFLPSPHEAGYPTDSAGRDLLKRTLATRVLLAAAQQITANPHSPLPPSDNAFLYALVARMTARLGLDSSAVANIQTTDTAFNDGFWDLRPLAQPDHWGEAPRALYAALAVLNRSLDGQTVDTENRLLHTLPALYDPVAWLSAGFDIPPDEANLRFQLAAWNAQQSKPQEVITLSCDGGVVLFSPGQARSISLSSEQIPRDHMRGVSRSPDGRRLAIDFPGYVDQYPPRVIDLETGTISELPGVSSDDLTWFQGWISNTRVAYTVAPNNSNDASQSRLVFLDTADPRPSVPVMDDVMGYLPSPDKTAAAIVKPSQPVWPYRNEMFLMPALGGRLTPVDDNVANGVRSDFYAAWSPNSRALVYAHSDITGTNFSLRLFDVTTGLTREIVSASDLSGEARPNSAFMAWSSDGQQIAFTASNPSEESGWLGVVNPDGSHLRLFAVPKRTWLFQPRISADEKYLALTLYDFQASQSLAVYDLTTGEQSLYFRDALAFDWSPAGHQMAVALSNGVYLFADPGDPNGQQEALVNDRCYSILWSNAP